ncbi:MAG: hypothetical protein US55_C0050G0008 [Candidatus Levybacteria bacterium GW2011_GWC2_37_7]|nr:MAG: hypothetical protein US55_C0050G0008 [Candidatus Levybacteria bacterium GW2011_GWC2_37_7]
MSSTNKIPSTKLQIPNNIKIKMLKIQNFLDLDIWKL